MKTVQEIMSRDPVKATADQKLSELAGVMQSQATGLLPIIDQDKLVGVVTDRDLVVRALAQKEEPLEMCARDAMTSPAICAHAQDEISSAARLMQQKKVRRLPVLDEREQLVGVVSVDDLASQGMSSLAGETLKAIAEEREPNLTLA